MVLSGDNSFSGGVDVLTGTLGIASADSLPEGSRLVIGAGGTFDFDPGFAASPVTPSSAVAAVPEPSTLVLGLAALMAAGAATAQKTKSIVRRES